MCVDLMYGRGENYIVIVYVVFSVLFVFNAGRGPTGAEDTIPISFACGTKASCNGNSGCGPALVHDMPVMSRFLTLDVSLEKFFLNA